MDDDTRWIQHGGPMSQVAASSASASAAASREVGDYGAQSSTSFGGGGFGHRRRKGSDIPYLMREQRRKRQKQLEQRLSQAPPVPIVSQYTPANKEDEHRFGQNNVADTEGENGNQEHFPFMSSSSSTPHKSRTDAPKRRVLVPDPHNNHGVVRWSESSENKRAESFQSASSSSFPNSKKSNTMRSSTRKSVKKRSSRKSSTVERVSEWENDERADGKPHRRRLRLNRERRKKYASFQKCSVCNEGSDTENDLAQCCGCGIRVHSDCYGSEDMHDPSMLDEKGERIFKGDFTCSLCAHRLDEKEAQCVVCPNTSNRAMKELADDEPVVGWVHIACALWTANMFFKDPEQLQNPGGLRFLDHERWSLKCQICRDREQQFQQMIKKYKSSLSESELKGVTKIPNQKKWQYKIPESVGNALKPGNHFNNVFDAALRRDYIILQNLGLSEHMNFPEAFVFIDDTVHSQSSEQSPSSNKNSTTQRKKSYSKKSSKRRVTSDGWVMGPLTDKQIQDKVKARNGAPIQCSSGKCPVPFHVTCAMRAGWEFTVKEMKSGNISKQAFCAQHSSILVVDEDEPCRRCERTRNPERMLICDKCSSAYHMECLNPPLQRIPPGKWFCEECMPSLLKSGSVAPTPESHKKKHKDDNRDNEVQYVTLDEEYMSSLPPPPALLSSDESEQERSDASDSDANEETGASSAVAASATSRPNSTPKSSPKDKIPQSVNTSHLNDYFAANRNKAPSRTKSVNDLALPDPSEAKQYLKNEPAKNLQDRAALKFFHVKEFQRIRLLLLQGYNIVFYGVGSKIELLERFQRYISRSGCNILVCNGYNPLSTIEETVRMIWEKFLGRQAPNQDIIGNCHDLLSILGNKNNRSHLGNSSISSLDPQKLGSWIATEDGKIVCSDFKPAKSVADLWPHLAATLEESELKRTTMASDDPKRLDALFQYEDSFSAGRLAIQCSQVEKGDISENGRQTRKEDDILNAIIGKSDKLDECTDDEQHQEPNTTTPLSRRKRQTSRHSSQTSHEKGDEDHLFIVTHNMDGVAFQSDVAKTAFSLLSQCNKIHLLCSVDHINAALLQDQQQRLLGNWIWLDKTTFDPYFKETLHTQPVMESQQELSKEGVRHVLHSLTPTHSSVLQTLADLQRQNPNSYGGIYKDEWYDACFDSLLLTSDTAFQHYLVEFTEHELVVTREVPSGRVVCYLPDHVLAEFPDDGET